MTPEEKEKSMAEFRELENGVVGAVEKVFRIAGGDEKAVLKAIDMWYRKGKKRYLDTINAVIQATYKQGLHHLSDEDRNEFAELEKIKETLEKG